MYKQEAKNSKAVQRANRLRILDLVRKNPGIVRSAIIEETGLSPASVSNIVSFLMHCSLVQESGAENVERAGRKGMCLRFDGGAHQLITACREDESLFLFLTDLSGRVLSRMEYLVSDLNCGTLIRLLCDAVRGMLALPQAQRVVGVGISLSALVLDGGRRVISSALGLNDLNLPALLEDIQLPVHVSNSSFTKAMWLCRNNPGWNKGLTLFVDLSRGMGAALIRNGSQMPEIIGEIGHTAICTDGRQDRLEDLCSPRRMLELCREKGAEVADLAAFSLLLESGHPAAQAALQDCALYLGLGLSNLVNLFNPDSIVINDWDFAACPAVIRHARRIMQEKSIAGLGVRAAFHVTRFDPASRPQAMACELCDALFSAQYESELFDRAEHLIFMNRE